MINLINIPFSYLCLSILLSGFTVFAFIKFIYIFFKTGRNEILPYIFLGLAAVLYISCDTTGLIYYILTSDYQSARIFINIRELSSLIFLIAIPYIIGQALILKPGIKRINSLLFCCGIVFTAVITAAALIKPELLIGATNLNISVNYRQIVVIQKVELLYIFKTILLMVYLLYALIIFLHSNTYGKIIYPVNKTMTGLFVLAYCALSGIFSIFFFNNNTGYVNFYYPHISMGIAVFLMFNSFGLVDAFIDYSSQLIKVKNDLKNILYKDSTLGIPNRNGFLNDLKLIMDELKESGRSFSLVFLDIDDFQDINESFGEKVGDEILKQLCQRLLDLFSSKGNLYRLGGDEFVYILEGIHSEDESINVASRIITSLRNPFPIFGESYLVTASLGIITIPRDGDEIDIIMNNAYSVIRDAKKTKNTYKIFTREIIDYSSKKVGIVNLLRTSISNDQFAIFYQPIVNADEKMIYAESLLRCTNPDLSIGGPGVFIPLMEKAGIMKDVDDMVIRKVFHDMEMHIKNKFNISINLSSTQLTDPAYSDFLSAFAEQQGIKPGEIILEVIENTLIENFAKGRESILRLKESGFKIAIDDFGKGFSSLSYLAELPIDILKIDMAFVESVPGDPKKEAIANHIMELAHSLGLKVVAEGFERREQFEFFKKLGCDNFQGYYFSRPLPLDELLLKYFHS
ncbi:MAG TPA: EAL domain-containing protein [Spirochaetota bacterium]|nr:EAL domain-containing protein [Spirochaetota bacterium]